MSFSFGPFMGKRDAVAAAVKAAVEKDKQHSDQIEPAGDFILAQLEKLSPNKGTVVRAYGHSDSHNRNVTVEVGQIGSYVTSPFLVE